MKITGLDVNIKKSTLVLLGGSFIILNILLIINLMGIVIPDQLQLLYSFVSIGTNIIFTITGVFFLFKLNTAYFKQAKQKRDMNKGK